MAAQVNGQSNLAAKQHVPAWKRLGLKLKYAKDTAETPDSRPKTEPEAPASEIIHSPALRHIKSVKRTRYENVDFASDSAPRPAKKGRNSTDASLDKNASAFANQPLDAGSRPDKPVSISLKSVVAPEHSVPRHKKFDEEVDAPPDHWRQDQQDSKPATPATRRKSVSFTPDTKRNDGLSGQESFKLRSLEDKTKTDAHAESGPDLPSPSKRSKKDKKRVQRQQPALAAIDQDSLPSTKGATTTGSQEVPEYVAYLQRFYTNRGNWKFNKKRQNDLLKNLFNIYRIPSEHDEALIAYISGLQGAHAQQRVLDDAETALRALLKSQDREADINDMDSRTMRMAAYEAALERETTNLEHAGSGLGEHDEQVLEDTRRRVERAKRAVAILVELLAKDIPSMPNVTVNKPRAATVTNNPPRSENTLRNGPVSTPVEARKRKRRKARTEVSSDESSSSSSSSSSSESEDE